VSKQKQPTQQEAKEEILKRLRKGITLHTELLSALRITNEDGSADPHFKTTSSYTAYRAMIALVAEGYVLKDYVTPNDVDIQTIPPEDREKYIRYQLNPRHSAFSPVTNPERNAIRSPNTVYRVPLTEIPTAEVLIGEGLGKDADGIYRVR
jgi:hypothetical protein